MWLALSQRIMDARQPLEEARSLARTLGEQHPLAQEAEFRHACWQGLAGDHEAAVAALEKCRDAASALHADGEHPSVLLVRKELAEQLWKSGRLAEAEAESRHVLERLGAVLGPLDGDLKDALIVLGNILVDSGRPAEAIPVCERVTEIANENARVLGEPAPDPANGGDAYWKLAIAKAKAGDRAGATLAFEAALSCYQRFTAATRELARHCSVGQSLLDQARMHAAAGEPTEAEAWFRRGMYESRWAVPAFPERYLAGMRDLEQCLAASGKSAEFATWLEAERGVLEARRSELFGERALRPWGQMRWGHYCWVVGEQDLRLGHRERALDELREAQRALDASVGPAHERSRGVREALAAR